MGQPIANIPNYIGQGEYIAFDGFFACRDERESKWRFSRLTMSTTKLGEMHFTYIGQFADRSAIIEYIRQIGH